jgi:ribosomal protein S18 acetylase RimI-like enzyme
MFSNPQIAVATIRDIPSINDLLNLAYRGEVASRTWTNEVHLIAGETRTSEAELKKLMDQPGSVFIKYCTVGKTIDGCVNLQLHAGKIYLGMLGVSPYKQGAGIGKKLLKAAEEYAQQMKCVSIFMTVISIRAELVDWYKRHGYKDTGEREKLIESAISGQHLQPLELMILEKVLSSSHGAQ